MYNILTKIFTAYNGKPVIFHFRNDTTDVNTILSILEHDEYHTKELGIKDGDVIIDIGAHIGRLSFTSSMLLVKS